MAADERERLESALTRRWLDLRESLDERSRRLWLAAEARSLNALAGELTRRGHPVSDDTVRRLLTEAGYSLQGNAKVLEGSQHPDRNAQFAYISQQVAAQIAAGEPAVSVDTKKKEKVGAFANGGAEWRPAGDPEQVNVHDFTGKELGKAIPPARTRPGC